MKLEIEKIKTFLDCDNAFVVTLFKSYLTESADCIKNLEIGLENNDWKLVKGAAHKMLSSTRIFNFKELTNTLMNIEKFSMEPEQRHLISEQVKTLERNQNSYINEIKKSINELNHEIKVT